MAISQLGLKSIRNLDNSTDSNKKYVYITALLMSMYPLSIKQFVLYLEIIAKKATRMQYIYYQTLI